MRRRIVTGLCFAAGLAAAASLAGAQPPEGGGKGDKPEVKKGPPGGPPKGPGEAWVARAMGQDADKDGKLSKDEVTDPRLKRLFDVADADKDGKLSKDELTALFAKEGPSLFGTPPEGFPKGPPAGFPKGGPGMMPPGMMVGPPQPGQVMPPFLRDLLKMSDEQKKQLDELQKDVDAKLGKILNDDQKKLLDDMKKMRGPGGFGPPPGFGPPGGFPGEPGTPPRAKDKPAPPKDKD